MPLIPLGPAAGVDRFTIGVVAFRVRDASHAASRVPHWRNSSARCPDLRRQSWLIWQSAWRWPYAEGVTMVRAGISRQPRAVPGWVSETWINLVVEESRCGRASSRLRDHGRARPGRGPLVLQLVGVYGPRPFLLAAALGIPVVLPLLLFVRRAPTSSRASTAASLATCCLPPVILLAGMTSSLGEQAAMAFLPIFALDPGVSAQTAPLGCRPS